MSCPSKKARSDDIIYFLRCVYFYFPVGSVTRARTCQSIIYDVQCTCHNNYTLLSLTSGIRNRKLPGGLSRIIYRGFVECSAFGVKYNTDVTFIKSDVNAFHRYLTANFQTTLSAAVGAARRKNALDRGLLFTLTKLKIQSIQRTKKEKENITTLYSPL